MDDDGIGAARHPGPPDGRPRLRSALNTLFVLVAVAGIGLSLWSVVTGVAVRARSESRERIDEACGGLVDPDRVLELHGGTVRVKLSDRDRVSTDERASGCTVYRVEASGKVHGHVALTLDLYPAGRSTDDRRVELDDEPFRLRRGGADDIAAVADRPVPHPLGDGRLGEYEADTVTARALCTDGGELSSAEVSAAAQYPGPVTPQDRRALAALARQAVGRAAAELGCATELPALPATLPVPKAALGPVAEAGGTCAWYGRFVAEQGRGPLPDRALASPAGEASAHDACLLALGEDEVRRIWPAYEKTSQRPRAMELVLGLSPLWMKTETVVGDGTRWLWTDSPLSERIDPAAPGTADGPVWWATSVCDGRPAVHLLRMAYPYDRIAGDRLEALLHAYAEESAARRGCTDVRHPEAADFARR
ncbi:hypothetical protein [Streptomyces sp. NRRL WC-3549]|uniref:hypothetical protein n=1 Tax=Streptomyces sp. NRRL WC-3549 TaxID=1463925 RepID=UPI000B1A2028|nr:hypothetical protein [Streptomyces sp. NRRL WC-3549]